MTDTMANLRARLALANKSNALLERGVLNANARAQLYYEQSKSIAHSCESALRLLEVDSDADREVLLDAIAEAIGALSNAPAFMEGGTESL